jgi:hypothetical protein
VFLLLDRLTGDVFRKPGGWDFFRMTFNKTGIKDG